MSRRKQRARETSGAARESDAAGRQAGARPGWGLGFQVGVAVVVFAVVTFVAEIAGAANLGVALGVGQIAFAIVVAYLLIRR